MILNDKEITELVRKTALISPFDKEKLHGVSYDITISGEIFRYATPDEPVDFADAENIANLYRKADASNSYLLKPGEYVLAPIIERLEMPDNICARILPRTSYLRLGVIISAQLVQPTYSGILKLGIYNSSPLILRIAPSVCVAQIVFEKVVDVPSDKKLYKNDPSAKYLDEGVDVLSKVHLERKKKYSPETLKDFEEWERSIDYDKIRGERTKT